MKVNFTILLLMLFLAGGFVSSCYEDSSTLAVNDIGNIEIDTTGIAALSVYQFEHLVVNPVMHLEGLSEADLEYTWSVNVEPDDTAFFVIGNEKNLDYEVRLKPNAINYHYTLTYNVTDKVHDLDYSMFWPLEVKNTLGEGLVVAETDDDANTDLSLIMSPEVTTGYQKVSVLRHVYSANNSNDRIEGLVKQMRFTTQMGANILLAITDHSIVKINTFDYSFGAINDDLFYAVKDSYNPQLLGGVVQGDIYVGDNRLTGTYLGITAKFGLPFDFSYQVPDHVAINPRQTDIAINFYDESLEGFVYLPSIQTYADDDMHKVPASSGVFNPASIPSKTNLAAATNIDGDFLHLLKDKTTGKIALYVLDRGGYEYPNYIAPAPKALYDFSSAPDIANAAKFVFPDNQKVMYYATNTKIYAALYGTSTPVFEERYTVASGETITTLQIYQQVGYPNSDSYIPTNNKQLILSTYSSEGKVYLLPLMNIGAGYIDTENIKTFDGFGRITAITPQK
jgi:hypothetical protein